MKTNIKVIPWREIAIASLGMQVINTTYAVVKLKQASRVAEKNAHLVAEVLTVTQTCAEACSDIADNNELSPDEAVRRIGSEFNFMMQAVGERLEFAQALNGEVDTDV